MSTSVGPGPSNIAKTLKALTQEVRHAAKEAGLTPGALKDAATVVVAATTVGVAKVRHQEDKVVAQRAVLDRAVVDLVSDAHVKDFASRLGGSEVVQHVAESAKNGPAGQVFRAFAENISHRAAHRYSAAVALHELGLPADFSGPLSLRELFADPSHRAAADKLLSVYYGWEGDPTLGTNASGLMASFPDPDLLEGKEAMRGYLLDPAETWSVSVQVKNGHVVGGVNYNIFEDEKYGKKAVLEHVYVDPAIRRQGNGRAIVEGVINQALASNPDLKRVLIEVDDPKLLPKEKAALDPMDPHGREAFWKTMGFQKIDHPYVQPSLGEDKQDVGFLRLGVLDLSYLKPGETFSAAAVREQPASVNSNLVRSDVKSYWGSWVEDAATLQGYVNQIFRDRGVPNSDTQLRLVDFGT